jgi:membrane protease YdiL (CAAX protease family)
LIYLAKAIVISPVLKDQAFSFAGYFHENNLLTPLNLLAWLLPSFTYGIFEETGWLGFALPVLQAKYSAFVATTILTLF